MKLMGAEVERHGPVGVLKIHLAERMMERTLEPDCEEFIEVHTAISIGLEELRFDDSIRIVVITGSAPDVSTPLRSARTTTSRSTATACAASSRQSSTPS